MKVITTMNDNEIAVCGTGLTQEEKHFLTAVARGQVDKVRTSLQENPALIRTQEKDIHWPWLGRDALMLACYYRPNPTMVRLLQSYGADATLASDEGDHPLMMLASTKQAIPEDTKEILGQLVDSLGVQAHTFFTRRTSWRGASKKWTPFLIAVQNDNLAFVEEYFHQYETKNCLKNKDPDCDQHLYPEGESALLLAIKNQSPGMVKLLLDHRADPNRRRYGDITPLMVLATLENPQPHATRQILNMLLDAGAENITNCFHETALDMAKECRNTAFIKTWNERNTPVPPYVVVAEGCYDQVPVKFKKQSLQAK